MMNQSQSVRHIQEFMCQYNEASPQTYKLYCAAVTFGASSATCENSFSTFTRILTPARRSMLQSQMSNLLLPTFEKELTSKVSSSEMLEKFCSKKRRLMV